MDDHIKEFFKSKSIAIVGVSASRMKFGSMAYRALKKNGYKVHGINPALDLCNGDTCYTRLSELPESVEAVFVSTKPENVEPLISEAVRHGVKRIWFQQGGDYGKLASQASEAGLVAIENKCLLMYAEPVSGIHRVHRFFAKLFGKY